MFACGESCHASGMRSPPERVDVLIVGAGLSGIGAAHHLQASCPQKSYAILEARDRIGGTWDLFRYPGIRSDSDMYTLGYSFRPWQQAEAIADGGSILTYIRETAAEDGIERRIHFDHRVVRADFSTDEDRWTVHAVRGSTGETVSLNCSFLFVCSGYYRYDHGYTPEFEGVARFGGRIVHPQAWTEDVEYAGKRVVVIGSGATAVTLVPALAEQAAHVTMLQRSPSYVISLPAQDAIAEALRRVLPPRLAYSIVRWKNVLLTMASYQLSRRRPKLMKALIRKGLERQLPAGYDIDTHFKPRYNPWDQRLCLVPNGDLFEAIGAGRASVVTDEIETFTENGIRLRSGRELDADLIVTATGLNLLALGGMQLAVDGREVRLPETISYKGMMLSDVPNLAMALGYTNASWTLKCDLTCEYVCRLLAHMDEHGYSRCTPRNRDPSLGTEPFIELLLRLRAALDRPVPQAGIATPVAPAPELRARHRRREAGDAGGWNARVRRPLRRLVAGRCRALEPSRRWPHEHMAVPAGPARALFRLRHGLESSARRPCGLAPHEPGGIHDDVQRGTDRGSDAPVTDRVDHVDLEIREPEAGRDRKDRQDHPRRARALTSHTCGREQHQVAEQAKQRHRDAARPRVARLLDLQAALGARDADRCLMTKIRIREVRGDRKTGQAQASGEPCELVGACDLPCRHTSRIGPARGAGKRG